MKSCRQILTIVICIALCLSLCTAALADDRTDLGEAQEFPCSTTEEFTALFKQQEAETPDKIYFHPYTGLFKEAVTMKDYEGERELYTYIADETPHCASSVYVAVPNGANASEFLAVTGWADLADEYHFLLHAMVPAGENWGEEAEELAYLAAAYTKGTSTAKYSPYTGNYYFVGYGEGGRLLQEYIMSAPDNCAGMAIFDGSEISADYLKTMAETPAVDPNKTVAQINVPVWLFNATEDVAEYWKSANECEDAAYTLADSTVPATAYFQSMVSPTAFVNAYPLGKVLLTEAEVSYDDAELSRTIWEDFLCKVQRYRSLDGNNLRPAFDPKALGFTKEERVIDGFSRYWLEYVPERVKQNPDVKVPMVIALHGAGQCGDVYAPYSEWFKVAEEAGFIAVFPTAYPFSENNGLARPIHNDGWDPNPNRPNEVSYWRQIIADVSERYTVDEARIYATGHSNGGNSSAMIAGEMSDVIAAVAISAGRFRNAENGPATDDLASLHEMASTYKVPVIELVGTNDGGAYRSPTMISTMKYWLLRDECVDLNNPMTYKTAGYNNHVWVDKDGVPMVRFTIIERKPHTTNPFESRLFWYEFLSHYARGEDGSVLYMQDPDTIVDDTFVGTFD